MKLKKMLFVLKHCNIFIFVAFSLSFFSVWYNYKYHSIPTNVTNVNLSNIELLINLAKNLFVGSFPFITFVLLKPYIAKVVKSTQHKRTYYFQIATIIMTAIFVIIFAAIFVHFLNLCIANKSVLSSIAEYYSNNIGCFLLTMTSLTFGIITSLLIITICTLVWQKLTI